MDNTDLYNRLVAMDHSRKAAAGAHGFALIADGAIALEMITLITNAYRNGGITYQEMQGYLNEFIVNG